MVSGGSLAMIPNDLETSNHLANSEESQTLGSNNTASNQVGSVEVLDALHERGGFWCRLSGSLDKRARVPQHLISVLEVLLERLHRWWRHLLTAEDDLGQLGTNFGVVYHERNLLLDESNQSPGTTTDSTQRVCHSLCST